MWGGISPATPGPAETPCASVRLQGTQEHLNRNHKTLSLFPLGMLSLGHSVLTQHHMAAFMRLMGIWRDWRCNCVCYTMCVCVHVLDSLVPAGEDITAEPVQ